MPTTWGNIVPRVMIARQPAVLLRRAAILNEMREQKGAPDEGPQVTSVAEKQAGRPSCASSRQGVRNQ
ncbi:hypothetical protein CCASP_01825 [Corynebacterium caspium DSM 44850]|nr:hypothetical protein CCASP_01825 [Corynebacterium caspium DSM 44850]